MLRKLLKHEIMETARWMLLGYAALIVLDGVVALFFSINDQMINNYLVFQVIRGIASALYGILMVGVPLLTVVVIVVRFYRSCFTDQGYLTFTLPVKNGQHILSKLLVAMMWMVITIVVTMLSVGLIALSSGGTSGIGELAGGMATGFGELCQMGAGFLPFAFLIAVLLGIALEVLHFYAAIAVGQLANTHRGLLGVGVYVGISILLQALAVMAMYFLGNNHFMSGMSSASTEVMLGMIQGFTGLGIAVEALITGVLFAVTYNLLDKHLNLR